MNNDDELRRLFSGPQVGEKPPGLLATFVAECRPGATETLHATREVWATAIAQRTPSDLTIEEWRALLPRWFVEGFGPELTPAESKSRLALTPEERLRLAETWTLSAWLVWLKPQQRPWCWWHAEILPHNSLRVVVALRGYPAMTGSLRWLLRCCGAISFRATE